MLRFYKLQNTDHVNNFDQCVSEQPISMSLGGDRCNSFVYGVHGARGPQPKDHPTWGGLIAPSRTWVPP